MIDTSIIIPVVDKEEYTYQCLESIEVHTGGYEIILVDNGSEIPFEYKGIQVIRNSENLGFPKAINQGIKASNKKFICILNNDTIVTRNWLNRLVWHLENNDLDMVGPLTNSISGPQKFPAHFYDDLDSLNKASERIFNGNKRQFFFFPRLVGFCLLMKRRVVEKIGYFDENFSPGNFEDDDYCLRAIQANMKLGIAKDVFIHHFGSVSHESIDYELLLKKNKAYFDIKWPSVVYNELIEKGFLYEKNKIGEAESRLWIS